MSLSFFSNEGIFSVIPDFHFFTHPQPTSKSDVADNQSDDITTDEPRPPSPILITRQFSYPHFYIFHPSSLSSVPITSHDNSNPLTQFKQIGSTENDASELPTGSRDSHVTIELGSCDQPRVQTSDSVPSYLTISPLSPSCTHTNMQSSSPPSLCELAFAALKEYTGGAAEAEGRGAVEDIHRRDFENGRIDYTGSDRFASIQEHIDSTLDH